MKSKFQRGFTMVELLVVIAILAILAALIFAGASKAMRSARGATCANNLRQCGVVVFQIKEEGIENGWNGPGFFPGYAGQISGPGVAWRKYNFHQLIGEQAGFCEFKNGKYTWSAHPSDTFLQNPLSKHVLCDGIETEDIDNNNYTPLGGFGYNHLVEGWTAPHTSEDKVKLTSGLKIKNPAQLILMAEQNPAITNKDGGIWMGPYEGRSPAGTNSDKAYCLMVDGHVEQFRNEYLMETESKNKHFKPLWDY